ncbi:unnamed protein product [Pieris macdunnoughi]|uniref:Uncharacterized protein n=1 Tax=Pieris macdunnoughi TaxID=345717 RepID=A0A821L7Z0_9NEOP|nr:unnamed protein product [Pieris macdunnoughi]
MQMYVGRSCVHALTHTGRWVPSPHNPLSPSASRQLRQRWFYACECTHAALSLEARHWLLKGVEGVQGGQRANRSERVSTGAADSVALRAPHRNGHRCLPLKST